MKINLLLTAIMIMVLSACGDSSSDNTEEQAKVDLTIVPITDGSSNTTIGQAKSSGVYDRGDAPVYIAGIDVDVDNQVYDVATISKTFDFVAYGTDGGDAMIVEGVTVGSNTITVSSIAEYDPVNAVLNLELNSTTDEINAQYFIDYLKEAHPIYAEYTGSVTTVVDLVPDSQTAEIAMAPQTARVSCVFYTETDLDYKVTVGCDAVSFSETSEFSGSYKAACFVLNTADLNGVHDISVSISTKPSGEDESAYTSLYEGTVQSEVGANWTYLYTYSDDIADESVGLNLTWTPMEDKEETESLDDD